MLLLVHAIQMRSAVCRCVFTRATALQCQNRAARALVPEPSTHGRKGIPSGLNRFWPSHVSVPTITLSERSWRGC